MFRAAVNGFDNTLHLGKGFLFAEMESLLRLISGERIALRGLIFVMEYSSTSPLSERLKFIFLQIILFFQIQFENIAYSVGWFGVPYSFVL
jgi:hypothetical protein